MADLDAATTLGNHEPGTLGAGLGAGSLKNMWRQFEGSPEPQRQGFSPRPGTAPSGPPPSKPNPLPMNSWWQKLLVGSMFDGRTSPTEKLLGTYNRSPKPQPAAAPPPPAPKPQPSNKTTPLFQSSIKQLQGVFPQGNFNAAQHAPKPPSPGTLGSPFQHASSAPRKSTSSGSSSLTKKESAFRSIAVKAANELIGG